MKKKWEIDGEMVEADIVKVSEDQITLKLENEVFNFHFGNLDQNTLGLRDDNGLNQEEKIFFSDTAQKMFISHAGVNQVIAPLSFKHSKKASHNQDEMISPMPGKVLKFFVSAGDVVETGDPLLILEAMKMEHTIKANGAGVVKKLFFKAGDIVDGGVELVEISYVKEATEKN